MEVAPQEPEGVTKEAAAAETLTDSAPTVNQIDPLTPASDDLSDAISSDVLDTATSVIPAAMQYGDLAALGLTGWTPAGLVRWGLEALHVSTGMPWFYTIIVASGLVRICMAPFQIITTRDTAKIAPYKEQIMAIAEKMRAARAAKDPQGMKNAINAQLTLYKRLGVNPVKLSLLSLVSLVVQIPVSLGFFFGIKKLCDLPIEHLKHSGFSLLPDLTIPDPTYILPLLMSALVNLQTKVCSCIFCSCTESNSIRRS
jgi:YidC/Oxa1 family membrane protein insertase